MAQQSPTGWLTKVIRSPGFWLIVAALALITVPHYGETLRHPAFLSNLMANLGLERHAFERILYLAPIVWAGFLFGMKGALFTSIAALVCMLPRAIFSSPFTKDALMETTAVFIVGDLVALTFEGLRRERERRIQLMAVNQISNAVSQSLELSQILNNSIDKVLDVMRVDAVLVYLVDEETGDLTLAAHRGITPQLAQGVSRLKPGEGIEGMVAQTQEPVFVEDVSQDPRMTGMPATREGIRSQLSVPMQPKGKVLGSLTVATYSRRQFRQDQVELLTTIANQISVAVDNAHLYDQERRVAEELRASEERYRELFENAHDAIWLHDLEGNLIAANKATEKLTGYSLEELVGSNVKAFLSQESLELAGQVRHRLFQGEPLEQPYTQRITRRDGTQAILELTTSLLKNTGSSTAFQCIARDVTKERQMQENLHYYLGQVTKGQEEERKRIARELHDETIQALVVLARQLDEVASRGEGVSEDKRLVLENLRQQTNNIMQGVRRLSQDLRPPILDRLGLLPALEQLASDGTKYSGITTTVGVLGAPRRLSPEAELVLFRITQEALRNVWRHSQANRAEVTAEFGEENIKIAVKDNGKGFDLPETTGDLIKAGRLGLAGMQERAQLLGGSVKVESQPGRGTTVTIEAPTEPN